jgi:hypothetical protein
MFVMISPLQAHLSETLTSLKFATKVCQCRSTSIEAFRMADWSATGTQHAYRNGKKAGEDKRHMRDACTCRRDSVVLILGIEGIWPWDEELCCTDIPCIWEYRCRWRTVLGLSRLALGILLAETKVLAVARAASSIPAFLFVDTASIVESRRLAHVQPIVSMKCLFFKPYRSLNLSSPQLDCFEEISHGMIVHCHHHHHARSPS